MKWVAALTFLFYFIVAIFSISSVNQEFVDMILNGSKHYYGYGLDTISFMIVNFIVIMILTFVAAGSNKNKTYLFLTSQPLTREQICFTKALTVLVTIIPAILIYYYVFVLNYIEYKASFDLMRIPYETIILKQFIVILTFSIVAITYFFIVNSFASNGIVSMMLSIFFIAFPLLMAGGIALCDIYKISMLNDIKYKLDIFISNILDSISRLNIPVYKLVIMSLIIIFIMTLVWKYLILKIYKKLDIENMNRIFAFKTIGKIIILLTSLVISFVPTTIFYAMLKSFNYRSSFNTILTSVLYIIMIPFLYRIQSKFINTFSKA